MWSTKGSSSALIIEPALEFGTRLQPIGGRSREEWERLRPRWRQVHGIVICKVGAPGQDCGEVDALWTDQVSLPVGVVTADCIPILLHRKDARAVGAIHAGWRGTLGGIPAAFFRSLPPEYRDPGEWRAVLGPSIRACCYEFGEDLIAEFRKAFPGIPRERIEPVPRRFDLAAVCRHQLLELGVRDIGLHPDCTFCSRDAGQPRYSSFRRGDRESRQISIISLEPRVC